jgi:hypothetical protein
MAVNENDPLHAGNQPGQQPIGYKPTTSLDHDGEQKAYGQDHDATNHNRDLQSVNAAHQPSQSHPDFNAQGRDGQQHPGGEQNDTPRTGNQDPDPGRQDEEGDEDGQEKVIPEVPLRREEREQQTPKANPGDPEELDRKGTDTDQQFPIDDSSKFSE